MKKYTEERLVNEFFEKNSDFIKIESENVCYKSITINNYIYISCYIKTKSLLDYKVIYDPECSLIKKQYSLIKSKELAFNEDDYWSGVNRGFICHYNDDFKDLDEKYGQNGIGSVLVILDSQTLNILNIFYFKDTYNIDWSINFVEVIDDKVIVQYVDYNYVFVQDIFYEFAFVNSYQYYIFGNLWINSPSYGYDIGCGWLLMNLEDKTESIIYALSNDSYPNLHNMEFCKYDYKNSKFIFYNRIESISFGYDVLTISEENISKLRYSNIGTNIGCCELIKD